MRAFLAYLFSLLLVPAAALAQASRDYQAYPQDTGAGVLTWFWWAIMAVVIVIALMAWGRTRDKHFRRPPPARP